METLFRMLISHYIHKINGFAEDIEVICDYEKAGEKIEVYRQLQFEDDEIYDTLADSPEYTYLKDELREIIEET